MFPYPSLKTITIPKVIGGISKTLGVINQIIPLYKEAKPMVNNMRNALGFIKEFSNNTTSRITTNTQKNMEPIKKKLENYSSINKKGPTFFQ